MNQSCYGLCGEPGHRGFYTFFSTRNLVIELRRRTHGSVFDTITRDTLKGVEVALPPVGIVSSFESLIAPLMEHIRENILGSRTLTALRDMLLPKLISGQLRKQNGEREEQ